MDGLAKWLGEQLDEDERIVNEALYFVDAKWRVDVARNIVLCSLPPSSERREVR